MTLSQLLSKSTAKPTNTFEVISDVLNTSTQQHWWYKCYNQWAVNHYFTSRKPAPNDDDGTKAIHVHIMTPSQNTATLQRYGVVASGGGGGGGDMDKINYVWAQAFPNFVIELFP